MPHRQLARRSSHLFGMMTAVCAWLVYASTATAQSYKGVLTPNATISGALLQLKTLPSEIRKRSCPSSACSFTIAPITLKLSVPGHKNISVSVDRVIDPRFIIRETNNQTLYDFSTRPLLLRGTARLRHAGIRGETVTIRTAGTLHLSDAPPTLELSLRTNRRGTTAKGIIKVRASLSQGSRSTVTARASTISSFALSEMTCGTHTARQSTTVPHESLLGARIQPPGTFDILYMATDFDSAWMVSTGCSSASACNNEILSLLNQAAVFYERQLGVTLNIARQYGPTTLSRTTDSSDLLYAFRAHNNDRRSNTYHNGSNTAGDLVDLFQLFTGRKMDQKVVGIAFNGVLCDNDSSMAAHMVVSHKSAAADPVITAHEIGHTLNASHTTSGIMTAVLGSPLPTSFNSFSLDEMSAYYASYRYQCRGGDGPGAPGGSAPGNDTSPTPAPGDGTPGPVPETMKLTVTKKGKDLYTIKTQVSRLRRGCAVSVRAGTSEADADTGTVIARNIPRSETMMRRARVNASIATNNLSAATIYLTADYECPGNDLIEVSPFVAISPNAGTRSVRKVSRRAWINLLNKAF